jgi:large subunit ribosomal protein L24
MSARLKKGDLVVVISGDDKGKTGKVARVLVEEGKVVVEGVALRKRHTRPTPRHPEGGIVEREQPIFASKVMPVDPKTNKPTRVRFQTDDKGIKRRLAKSGEEIGSASATSKEAKKAAK